MSNPCNFHTSVSFVFILLRVVNWSVTSDAETACDPLYIATTLPSMLYSASSCSGTNEAVTGPDILPDVPEFTCLTITDVLVLIVISNPS